MLEVCPEPKSGGEGLTGDDQEEGGDEVHGCAGGLEEGGDGEWYSVSPKTGVMLPGEKLEIKVTALVRKGNLAQGGQIMICLI